MSQISEIVHLDWDNAAQQLVGTVTVIEVQHYDAKGAFLRHDHIYGLVSSADRKNGIRLIANGKTFNGKLVVLPAQLDSFTRPKPGSYKLKSTGETVTDPHWFTTWMVKNADAVRAVEVKRPRSASRPRTRR